MDIKIIPMVCYLEETHFTSKGIHRLSLKGENCYYTQMENKAGSRTYFYVIEISLKDKNL
jgi:hypothetical protein